VKDRRKPQAPRIHLVSLGCAKNLVDSERVLGRLSAAGAIVGAPGDEADIILVNTCGFIGPAKEESIETILEMARRKTDGVCRKLLVMGCLAQRYAAELRDQLPEVDGVFGLGQDAAILAACGLGAGTEQEAGRLLLTPKHSAYLRIADGCDNCCAYCTIPMIRGSFRSRPPTEILDEAEALVARGARELNLIGQDTTLYGTDLTPGMPIHELLAGIATIRKLKWLRLLYTHPAHFTDALIEAFASVPKLCPYVDIPLQHLNDDILKRMGRKVTQAQCLDLIERIRRRVRNVAVRTAFIVGFPGETRRQFNELLRLVERIRFDHLGVFAYSREQGTRAARMSGQVSEAAKARRLRDLMLTQQEIVFEKNRAMKGRQAELLVESRSPDMPDAWIARSRAQAPDVDSVTYVAGDKLKPGRFVKAAITGARGYDLLAETPVARRGREQSMGSGWQRENH